MSGHYLRKRARSGGWAWSLACFAAMLLAVGLVFFRMGALDLTAFSYAVLSVAVLVAAALGLALLAIARAWGRGDRGGGKGVAALFLAILLATPFALGIALALEHPDSASAQTEGIPAAQDFPAAPTAGAPTSLLLGREFRATAAQVYSAARSTLEGSGWDVVGVEASGLQRPAEGDLGVSGTVLVPVPTLRDTIDDATPVEEASDPYAASDSDAYSIAAVAYMPVLGFASDVTVRIVEEAGVSFVDMRSVSRDLPRDLGQNRRFIEAFFGRLEAAMDLLESGPVEE